ncbi:hypothetical protein HOH45_09430 [bacterium]|nr:hypothetical protein [bacterium]
MAKSSIPASISLLSSLAIHLDKINHLFSPLSTEFHHLKEIVKTNKSFSDSEIFFESENLIAYLQCLMLAGMSMKDGIFVPSLKQYKEKDGTVLITWDSQVQDKFTFGSIDDNFLRYFHYYRNKIFNVSQSQYPLPVAILYKIRDQLASDYEILLHVKNKISPLLKEKHELLTFFDKTQDQDIFFIIMSCLPTEGINALFINIQQYFPRDLKIKSHNGHMINVLSLFQAPSTDIFYLMEKIHVYFDLYFSGTKPIIREITKSKTKEFMKNQLTNDTFFTQTQQNLESLVHSQINVRIQLFQLLLRHLKKLDLKN